MRRKNTKILAFGLAALLAASNVIPALAAYKAPGSVTWQGSLNMDSPILKRSITAENGVSAGSGSEPTKAPEETSADEPSTDETTEGATEESTESTDESTAPSETEESTEGTEKPGTPGESEGGSEGEDESTEEEDGEYRPASGSEIPELFRASGVFELKKATDLTAAFPDAEFRNVVFEAIKDWEEDTGEQCIGADMEEALAKFTGDINASKKKIKEITGIKYLVNAGEINLSQNDITDWRPAAGGSKEHYGHDVAAGEDSTNVTWKIDRNPITQLPYSFGGRLVIDQPATHAYTYKRDAAQDKTLSFVRRSDEAGKSFEGTYNIERCKIEQEGSGILEPVEIISVNAVKGTWDKPILTASKIDNSTAKLTRIMKSGTQLIGMGVDEILRYDTSDEYGTITPGKQSFKYYVQAKIAVYDSVSVEQTPYRGSVILTKTDSTNTSKKLPGATYELVKGTPGADQGVVCTKITDAQGTITVMALEPGKYFFRETNAPEGYTVNTTPSEFEVFDRQVQLGGGSTTALDGTTSVSVSNADKERYIAGPTSYGNGTPDIALALVPGDADLPLLGKARYDVIYSSIGASPDNPEGEQITKTFYMPGEAAADINKYKNKNRITGPVKIKVTFEKTAAGAISISTTDEPTPGTPEAVEATELSGTKIWKDEPNYTGMHPDVMINVYQKADKSKTPVRSLTLHDGQEAFKFYDLPKYDSNNNEIQYAVEEKFVDPAESEKFYVTQSGNTITNTYIKGKTHIEGMKGWNDTGWQDKVDEEPVRPTITIDLYRNNSYYASYTIIPDLDSYRFADLDLRDSQGNDYKYTVRERAVADWTSHSRDTYDFENVFTPGTPPSGGSHGGGGGGGGGGNPPSPRPNVPPTPYGPGTIPPEEVPPTPGLPPETPPKTPQGENLQDPNTPAPLPKTGEERIPAYYLIFLSGAFTMAIYVTNIGKREDEE